MITVHMHAASGLKRAPALLPALLLPVTLLFGGCAAPPPPQVKPAPVAAPVPVPPQPIKPPPAPAYTPEQQALRQLSAQQARLYSVAAPLLVNNPQLCKGNARNLLGFTAKNQYSYTDEFIDAAHKGLGLDERLQVTGVLAGSGAARVGVRPGDKLVSVDDNPMPQGRNAQGEALKILAPLVSGRSSVTLAVLRNGADVAMNVPLTLACAFGIELGNADHVNSYADGLRVLVTRGMLNFAATDEELAYVLARGMAHNVLKHPTRQRMSATVAGIIDNLVRMRPDMSVMVGTSGVKPATPDMDVAADKLALYMVARAGYSIDNALPFWQRLATQFPAGVLNGYTAIHPATAARLSTVEKTILEIKAKLVEQKPLIP